jgi:Protein of unknown function (DUF2937)
MLARFFYSLGAATGGAALSQFPEYYTHYVQRLGGRVDQARLRAAGIRDDAAAKGLSVEDYIKTFLDSEPHALEGARMWDAIFRLDEMEAAYHALREAPAVERPFAFASHLDSGLVDATLADFAPAVPLTPEGLAYAAVGALAALALMFGTRRVVRRRRHRPKELQA